MSSQFSIQKEVGQKLWNGYNCLTVFIVEPFRYRWEDYYRASKVNFEANKKINLKSFAKYARCCQQRHLNVVFDVFHICQPAFFMFDVLDYYHFYITSVIIFINIISIIILIINIFDVDNKYLYLVYILIYQECIIIIILWTNNHYYTRFFCIKWRAQLQHNTKQYKN